MSRVPSALLRAVAVLAGFAALTAWSTWPLVAETTQGLPGDDLDPWQTLWGFWWFRQSLAMGASPFWTDLLWWPDGTALWFQSWDLPSTLAAVVLWPMAGPFAAYNIAVLASFVLAGFTFYLMAADILSSRIAAFLAAATYTFSSFHFASAAANLHVASIQWSPIFFLGLFRMMKTSAWQPAACAGVGLSLAALTSTYHLLFCLTGGIVVGVVRGWTHEQRSARHVQLAVFAGTCLALFGWLYIQMALEYRAEAYSGAHDSARFSLNVRDLVSFGGNSRWASELNPRRLNESPWAASGHLGNVLLAIAVVAWFNIRGARPYCWLAVVGLILALGPYLQVGKHHFQSIPLPYGLAETVVPFLAFSGMPGRFIWLTTFALSLSAGFLFRSLISRGRRGCLIACMLASIVLVEALPRPFATKSFGSAKLVETAIAGTSGKAILDGTPWGRALWHQTLHGQPILNGYATRVPERNWRRLSSEPELRMFFESPFGMIPPRRDPRLTLERLNFFEIGAIIVPVQRAWLADELGLPLLSTGDGVAIYRVPSTNDLLSNRSGS